MFSAPNVPVRRARDAVGNMTPITIPSKGMNARDMFATMAREYAISLVNVICEPYGLRTRKGYTEWATNLPGMQPVQTVMSYYPATAAPAVLTRRLAHPMPRKMVVEPRADPLPPAGKMFAATNGNLYDVTNGGTGPWLPQAGVAGGSDRWTWINFQNIAGRFLIVTNDLGSYAYYDGATWTTPTMGSSPGQIDGINPGLFCHVVEFKKRLWFVEFNSTAAWYLPVSQITGLAKRFDFGEQFRAGGHLVALANWTVDGGEGVDDYLIAVSSQGDVVVYKGTDPDSATDFALHGVWNTGPLPVGRRSVLMTGSDVHILSHFGVTPLSALLSAPSVGSVEQRRVTYLISPLVARLMRDYSTFPGWSVRTVPKEELLCVMIPVGPLDFGGEILAMKVGTGSGWSVLNALPFHDMVSIDGACFAGGANGRVLRAFDGALDNVLIGQTTGEPIQCQVTPAYQPMGTPGQQKIFKLVRPTFLTTLKPTLTLQILTDYGLPKPAVAPTLPDLAQSLWDVDLWNLARWSGVQDPIKEWLGCRGVGFVGTVQLDYRTGGDTLLASIDFWTEQGGVL